MLHCGTGHSQLQNFMSTLEIQSPHHTSMKRREQEVEAHIESVRQKSCSDALNEEIELQKKKERYDQIYFTTVTKKRVVV